MYYRLSRNTVCGTGIRWPSQFADYNDQLVDDRMQQPNYHERDVIRLQFLGPVQYLTFFFYFQWRIWNSSFLQRRTKYIKQKLHKVALPVCESKCFVYETAESISTKFSIINTRILYCVVFYSEYVMVQKPCAYVMLCGRVPAANAPGCTAA